VNVASAERQALAPAMLFSAHPGHELRVYGWLRRARPAACYLTDGSGADGVPRLQQTSALLASVGAVPGPMYGMMSDQAVYAALLDGDGVVFCDLARRLAALLSAGAYATVVGDAAEGYNPSHDVARMLIDASVALARKAGAHIDNFAFPLVGHPHEPPLHCRLGPEPVSLDEATLQRKIDVARAYARESGAILKSEVDTAIEQFGVDAFKSERMFIANDSEALDELFDDAPPFYETYGERQVAAGRYTAVIRWSQHVRPVAHALRQLTASP
jgi:hypothetical protein